MNKDCIVVKQRCPFCRIVGELEVPLLGYIKWESGELVQNALPELDENQREFLISGMCRKCQSIFDEPEE